MARKDQFYHCLARKLYTYALGRELSFADAGLIDSAVQHMTSSQLTMRSLIHHAVASEQFQSK
jgi:hypothetical protein